jgi:bifunctional enzyme CysN/CysC
MAHSSDLIGQDIVAYLQAHERKGLLRFITCGSVDDGKSTLIGRLLYESKLVYEDQLAALAADSKKVGTQGDDLDFALLVDGLAAEREQGITIDVAYRFFSTDRRKFIVADTPGHEQYTRNMVTGASTADLAVILIDARKGVLTQTRRHSFIVSLLGIRHVVVAMNKMDLVENSQETYDRIVADYHQFAAPLGFGEIVCIPMSALKGDNIVTRSPAHALVHGPGADGTPRAGRRGGSRGRRAVPAAGAVGEPAELRFPRLLRHGFQRAGQRRRPAARAAVGKGGPGRAHRHL